VIVRVYTRHSADCPKKPQPNWSRCRCPRWLWITDQNGSRRISAKTRSWEKAEQKARALLAGNQAPSDQERTTILFAIDRFLEDKKQQNLADATLEKNEFLLRKQLAPYAKLHGLVYLNEIALAHLEQFRATWKDAPLARKFKQQRLSSFFLYCVRHKWLAENPVGNLSRVRVKDTPTFPFTAEEFNYALAMIDTLYGEPERGPNPQRLRDRLRAFVLLLRWSGLRIGDAVTLATSRLRKGKLLLYMQKTGEPVYLPLPAHTIEALSQTENDNPQYFFWSGRGEIRTAISHWQARLAHLFSKCGFQHRAHAHMLRDTFAVELLLAGVSIEIVSVLLGHTSVKTTERHYGPWVKARQDQLEAAVRESW